jgi:hypothetical protein
MSMTNYDARFYKAQRNLTYNSAREVVPLILQMIPVGSVCDVGCGDGTWLRAFHERGVLDFLGIDGEYVKELLQIPFANFQPMDLRDQISLQRTFDLAISLEVAEHLPESRGTTFVKDLTHLAPVVLFSAAIPGQGGVEHINEQWQTYWVSIFAEYRYVLCDVIRPKIWRNRRIAHYYRQNTLLFCNQHLIKTNPVLASHSLRLPLVHPEQLGFRDALRAIATATPRSTRRFLQALWH